ncbi:MAG: hypothetical protein IGS48_05900 [Oscillatoriales cyanobacterium C42_A2020_001]|nr:hypothetical protein [Leptolyngbyaceae cyanobacterium C42_A2020_001]
MTTANEQREPTLLDVIEKLDSLSGNQEQLSQKVEQLSQDVERYGQDQEKFNNRFDNYQKATQWVVQLAFTLIASATLTVIITAVFKR